MDAGLPRDVLTLLLGVATGVLSALFGVGGAVVSTPGIRALGASAVVAVGTTLPSIFPSALSGTARYVREQLVDWEVVRHTAPLGVAASIGGSLLSRAVPGDGHLLMLATAVLLGFTALRMATPPARVERPLPQSETDAAVEPVPPPPASPNRSPWLLSGIGVVAGALSGLLGVGGGIVMVPAFSEIVRLPLKTSIASSLVCVAAFALPGTVTHWLLGGIDWRFAIPLAVGVVPGARIGAALAIRTSDVRLRLVVSAFLGVTAVLYAVGELVALMS